MNIPAFKLPRYAKRKFDVVVEHYVDVDVDIKPDEAMNPLFWQHMADRISLGDEIVVRPTDYSYRLHVEVVAKDSAGHWVAVRKISLHEGLPFAADTPDEADFSYNKDPVMGWRVLRGKDVVASRLPNETAAVAKINELKAANKPKRVA